jgi:exodeoxyribonuclease V alpha subunit
MPYPNSSFKRSDYEFFSREEPADALEEIKRLVTVEIPSRLGLDPVNDIQVLTPMHKGPLGVFSLNMTLQSALNKSTQDGIFKSGQRLGIGDKVMQIKNNYDLGIFNGDLGRITAIDTVSSEVEVDFDGKLVPLMPSDLDDITLAYACSIHKSQGSEYPAVVIAMHTSHYIMLKRNLLYTAVTRGKRFVAVVGSAKALSIAVKNNTTAARLSLLKDRLMGKGITSDTL